MLNFIQVSHCANLQCTKLKKKKKNQTMWWKNGRDLGERLEKLYNMDGTKENTVIKSLKN